MKIIGIAKRQGPRKPMQLLQDAYISATSGVDCDYRGRTGKRQVTLLSIQQWEKACQELETTLPWTFRRANLLVDGIEFRAQMLNKLIIIGAVTLKVEEETEPCLRMDQQHQGLTKALQPDWRGGICCSVLTSGEIKLGDQLKLD